MNKALQGVVVGKVDGAEVKLGDLLRRLKSDAPGIVEQTVSATLVRNEAAQRGIVVDDAALQQAADDFRQSHGLHGAVDTQEWLKRSRLDAEEFEAMVEDVLLSRRLKQTLIDDRQAEQLFAEHLLDFETLDLAMIVVGDAELANELHAQIVGGEADFMSLALRHSIDPVSSKTAGYLAGIGRGVLAEAVEMKVFGEPEGSLISPFEADGQYFIVRVLRRRRAQLDEATREHCRDLAFTDWLAGRLVEATPVLDL
jgi:parvulin-like peptidyl-prolyl isomerase